MACKEDIRSAILNKVMEELVQGRYTFTRIDNDTIQINSSQLSRAKSNNQAMAIAQELANRTEKSFYGHVKGEINQMSAYDPVTVRFIPSDAYINHAFKEINDRDLGNNNEKERELVNNNTGYNTDNQINYSPIVADEGAFEKFIKYKIFLLNSYNDRLNKIKQKREAKGITTDELNRLNKLEREVKIAIYGNETLGKKGLEDEIVELAKVSTVEGARYYIEKDLERLSRLVNSNDIDDIREARRIINFYTLAGTFDWKQKDANPFFSAEDIFLKDDSGELTEELRNEETAKQFKEWSDIVNSFNNRLDKKEEELLVDTVNKNYAIKKTFGNKQFSYNQLVSKEFGLKDTDWFSMWTLDGTTGIFSHNGILPQVQMSELTKDIEEMSGWSREVEEKINNILPKVQKSLEQLDNGKYKLRGIGILGLKGVSFNLFKQVSKEGNETHALVSRFTKEYEDALEIQLNNFRTQFKNAKTVADFDVKNAFYNKIFEDLKRWRRANSIILDVSKIPEIASEAEFSHFGAKGDTAYRDKMVDVLGKKGYKEEVDKQKRKLRDYLADRQDMIDYLLVADNNPTGTTLSPKGLSVLNSWENSHNPVRGVDDYKSVRGLFVGDRKANSFMDYNSFVPRKYQAKVSIDPSGNEYFFEDTDKQTGHYDTNFAKIESDKDLSEFYDIAKDVCEKIRDSTPYEIQSKLGANTLPALNKVLGELIIDKDTGILSAISLGYRNIMDRLRTSFGITKQSEVSYANIDPTTGRANYEVNADFIKTNARAIDNVSTIEQAKFKQALKGTTLNTHKYIGKFTSLPFSKLNSEAYLLLAQYTHTNITQDDINNKRLDKLFAKTGEDVQIGRLIRDYSIHSVVQSQSFDLPKLLKYFANATMKYAARNQSLPMQEIMKKHYEQIEKPDTTTLGKGILHKPTDTFLKGGIRTRAITQNNSWFSRAVLGKYNRKHAGEIGTENKVVIDKEGNIKTNIPYWGKNIYTSEEKNKIQEIDKILSKLNANNEEDKKEINRLNNIKNSLGKTRVATAAVEGLLSWTRTLKLGYNLSSATTNFVEGVTSNMILASSGDYFNPNEIYYAYGVVKHSFLKNLSFGLLESGLAKKCRVLMDRYNVIIDSVNELQKSSNKSYADKLDWANPHALNQRTEYINQSPVMIAMLRTITIKDKNGNESPVWDAMNKDGHLLDNFRTQENIANWETLAGVDYSNFKEKLHKAIGVGHGLGYDELRGMLAKESIAGAFLVMFKTWLPSALYWRLGEEQEDIQAGKKKTKGIYRSYGKGGALVHGAAVGTITFGFPIGTIAGGTLGYLAGAATKNARNSDTGISTIIESIEVTKQLALKALGITANFATGVIAGKSVIKENKEAFNKWVGQGKFTQQDANNMRANMADLSMQLVWLAMILLVKSMFWDDDDKPDDPERIAHNILVNKLMQLSSQAGSYISPTDIYNNTFGSVSIIQYLKDATKETVAAQKFIEGDDTISSGVNAGKSRFSLGAKKLLMPGLFKDSMFGFESQSKSVFQDSPFQTWFRSEEKKDKSRNKADRSALKQQLEQDPEILQVEDEKQREKIIKTELDEQLPTPAKLKKLGLTRDEYNELLKQSNSSQ